MTATDGVDFTPLAWYGGVGTITFEDGDATEDLLISPTGFYDDGYYEGDETLALALLDDPSGQNTYTVGSPAAVTVTIHDNDPLAVEDSFSMLHDQAINLSAPGVLENDIIPEGMTPVLTVISPPSHGTLTLNDDGSFTFEPEAGFVGQDFFTYAIGSGWQAPSATVTLDFYNNSPGGTVPAYHVHAGLTMTVDDPGLKVFIHDLDVEDAGDLTYELITPPEHAEAFNFNSDATFTYTPADRFAGTDSFTFLVSDGAADSYLTVPLVVENHAPVAQVDEIYVKTNSSFSSLPGLLLANDYDLDSDPLAVVMIANPPNPAATASFTWSADGSFTFTPAEDFSGFLTFVYVIDDGTGTSSATVGIQVTGGVVARDDYYMADETGTVEVTSEDSLFFNDFNPDNVPLRAQLLGDPPPPEIGNLVLNDLRPDGTFNGTFSFTAGLEVSPPVYNFWFQLVDEEEGLPVGSPARVFVLLNLMVMGRPTLTSSTFDDASAAKSLSVTSDPGAGDDGNLLNDKQWDDHDGNGFIEPNEGEKVSPLVYVRNTKVITNASFALAAHTAEFLSRAPANGLPIAARFRVEGLDSEGGKFFATFNDTNPAQDRMVVDKATNELKVLRAESTKPLRNAIALVQDYLVDWKLHVVRPNPALSMALYMGRSENQLYLIWKRPPENFKMFHTLVYVSTKAAAGTTIEAAIPGAVFAPFAGRAVERANGTPMSYYGQWSTNNTKTIQLIRDADGMCGAWANFYLDCLIAQGLDVGGTPWVTVRSTKWKEKNPNADEWFLVRNWKFIANPDRDFKPAATGMEYDWENIMAAGDTLTAANPLVTSRAAGSYQFPNSVGQATPDVDGNKDPDGGARTGLGGQNQATPPSVFNNHAIVEVGGVWYDPSYGIKYDQGTPLERFGQIEANAVVGYALERQRMQGANTVYVMKVRKTVPGTVGLTRDPNLIKRP